MEPMNVPARTEALALSVHDGGYLCIAMLCFQQSVASLQPPSRLNKKPWSGRRLTLRVLRPAGWSTLA